MNATAIIGIVILVLFVGSFIAYGVVLYLGREHKQTVLVKSKYTTPVKKIHPKMPELTGRRPATVHHKKIPRPNGLGMWWSIVHSSRN